MNSDYFEAMSNDYSWTYFTTLQLVSSAVGIAASIFTILDIAINNSAVLTRIAATLLSGIFVKIKIWQPLTFTFFVLVTYVLIRHFKYDYEYSLGVDWIPDGEEDEVEYPIPLCPECGMELEIDSKVVDTFDPYTPGVRSSGSVVCARTTCDRCGFEKEWTEITDEVVSTLSEKETSELGEKVRSEAIKRIRSKRRR
ncbi:hypothetical protein [Salinibacter ruber]|uniref:hypothetical protein n=1 Tax=Salinibacter ruber TaxID=146919 RepID=UPI0013C3630A|nr:hypothetical protein [Salinibacter ruber]